MSKQPQYTSKIPKNDPTCCSRLKNKICLRSPKHSPDREQDKNIKSQRTYINEGKRNVKKQKQNADQSKETIVLLSRILKVTRTLPLAIQSNEAYDPGKKKCETCELQRADYKDIMETITMVEMLVQDVVERGQREMMDDEDSDDSQRVKNKPHSGQDPKKCSFSFGVYGEKDVKHNLKCVLVRLQKLIGDLLMQISYVKTRKRSGERFEKFNIPINDLQKLKYEYSKLTDIIITLLKSPPGGKKRGNEEICVACIKVQLTDYMKALEQILEKGQKVRMVMRYDRDSTECCHRDYPHMHANVKGKPLVLKYKMPQPADKQEDSPEDDYHHVMRVHSDSPENIFAEPEEKSKELPNYVKGYDHPGEKNEKNRQTPQMPTLYEDPPYEEENAKEPYQQVQEKPDEDDEYETYSSDDDSVQQDKEENPQDKSKDDKSKEPDNQPKKNLGKKGQTRSSNDSPVEPEKQENPNENFKKKPKVDKHKEPDNQPEMNLGKNGQAHQTPHPDDPLKNEDKRKEDPQNSPDKSSLQGEEKPKDPYPQAEEKPEKFSYKSYSSNDSSVEPEKQENPHENLKEKPKGDKQKEPDNQPEMNLGKNGQTHQTPHPDDPLKNEDKSKEDPQNSPDKSSLHEEEKPKDPYPQAEEDPDKRSYKTYSSDDSSFQQDPQNTNQDKSQKDTKKPVDDGKLNSGQNDEISSTDHSEQLSGHFIHNKITPISKDNAPKGNVAPEGSPRDETENLHCGCNDDQFLKNNLSNEIKPQNGSKDKVSGESSLLTISQISSDQAGRPAKNKRVSFMSPKDPLASEELQSSSLPTESEISFSSGTKHPDNRSGATSKTPFGGESQHTAAYVAKPVDSFVLTRQRISTPNDVARSSRKSSRPSVSEILQPYIKNPKGEVELPQQNAYVKGIQPKPVNLDHKNNKIGILLKYLSPDELLSNMSPAECCRTSSLQTHHGSSSEFPLSASLYSLPLDSNDIKYIVEAAGKEISPEDMMVLAEDKMPIEMYDWETVEDKELHSHPHSWSESCANPHLSHSYRQPNTSASNTYQVTNRDYTTNMALYDEFKTLPTISEEENNIKKKKLFHRISLSSTPRQLTKKEKKEVKKQSVSSPKQQKTYEMRYFTVEFEKENNNQEMDENKLTFKSLSSLSKRPDYLGIKDSKHSISHYKVPFNISNSFQSCHPLVSRESPSSQQAWQKARPHEGLSSQDKMLMREAIYLCQSKDTGINQLNPPGQLVNNNNILESHVDFNYLSNSNQRCRQKVLNANLENTKNNFIENNEHLYVQNLLKYDTKTITNSKKLCSSNETGNKICSTLVSGTNLNVHKPINIHKSYTVIKNADKSFKNENLIKTNSSERNTLCSFNFNTQDILLKEKTNENIIGPALQDLRVDSKGYSGKINPSYTIIKETNKNMNTSFQNKSLFPAVQVSKLDLRKSHTIVKSNKEAVKKINHPPNSPFIKDNVEKPNGNKKLHYDAEPVTHDVQGKNNWFKLNPENVNVKNYIKNQPYIKLHDKEIFSNYNKDIKRKPMILKNSNFSYRRAECDIARPMLKYVELHPVETVSEIPILIYKSKNGDENLTRTEEEMYGINKSYVSVKRNPRLTSGADLCARKSFSIINCTKTENLEINCLKKNNSPTVHTSNMTLHVSPKLNSHKNTNIFQNALQTNNKFWQEMKEYFMIDQHCNPLSLFDRHGFPLTDNYGRPLRNIRGELLLICDDRRIPICDINNEPIYDAYGRTMDEAGFNPVRPSSKDIFRSFTTMGGPMMFYDTEGKPLTSVSGTMLVDSKGEGLIRFGHAGNPVSDYKGRPIYDFAGKQIST